MRASLSALILIVAQLSGAVFAQSAANGGIAASGKLRVAMIGANPVLVTTAPDGKLSGVSVELGKLIADRLGVPLEPVVYASPASYTQSFGKGEWDIAIGPRDSSRAAGLEVSPDFMLVDNLYVAAPGRTFTDYSEIDRAGVKVAVALDGAPDKFLSRVLKSAQLVRVSGSVEAAVDALKNGAADVYGSNGQFVYLVADRLPGSRIIPGAFTSVPMAVALAQGRSPEALARLAQIVNEAKRSGIVQQAIKRAELRGVRVAPDQ